MPTASPLTRRTFRTAVSILDILWWLLFLLLLLLVVLPTLSRSRGEAKRALCSANLRGIGQGMQICANDNYEWFPHHYYKPTYVMNTIPAQHGVRWVGTMGSNDFLRITKEIAKTPRRQEREVRAGRPVSARYRTTVCHRTTRTS